MKLSDFKIGQRVQLHPSTDAWMKGDRYGEVMSVGHKDIVVRMDKSRRLIQIDPANILKIVSSNV